MTKFRLMLLWTALCSPLVFNLPRFTNLAGAFSVALSGNLLNAKSGGAR